MGIGEPEIENRQKQKGTFRAFGLLQGWKEESGTRP